MYNYGDGRKDYQVYPIFDENGFVEDKVALEAWENIRVPYFQTNIYEIKG